MPHLNLTDIAVKAIKGSDRYITYWDIRVRGFGLRVGKRSKTFVVMRGRKRERLTVGRYPDVGIADARAMARRLLVAEPQVRICRKNFSDARDEFVASKFSQSTSRWPQNVKVILHRHFKILEGRQLEQITDGDIEFALSQIKGRSAKLHAFRVIRAFFNWALKPPQRYLRHSPMEGYDPPSMDRRRTRILSDDELKAVWNVAVGGSRTIFRLLILWGTRRTETTRIEREWVQGDVLTIPGFHEGQRITKSGRDHAIPLLPMAKQILGERPPGRYFFHGRYSDDVPLNSDSLNRMRREIQEESGTSGWTAHDLRRTFRSNMARLGVPREICERLINHAPAMLDEIYDRYDRRAEKQDALARYEAFLTDLIGSGDGPPVGDHNPNQLPEGGDQSLVPAAAPTE